MVAKAVQKSPKEIIGVDLKTFIKFSSMLSNKDRYINIMIAEKNIVLNTGHISGIENFNLVAIIN